MTHTYSDNRNIYLVDLMFLFVNSKQSPTSIKIQIHKLKHLLEQKCWGNPVTGNLYSPNDVITKKINDKKREKELLRISKADLRYPIFLHKTKNKTKNNYWIVDGMHRLAKAHLNNKKTINAYVFDDILMDKFVISKRSEGWSKIDALKSSQIIKIFNERFTKDDKEEKKNLNKTIGIFYK
jgi:hypothetical protein